MTGAMSLKRILCPTDFSPGAEHALQFAARLAIQHDSELIVFHSWSLPAAAYTLEYPFPPEATLQLTADAQAQLDVAIAKARSFGAKNVRGEVVSGIPWVEITRTLDNRGIDLCVIGSRGRTGIKRILLGSVAEKVVRHAHCSVLVVPPGCELTAFNNVLVPTDFSANAESAAKLAASLVAPNGKLQLLHCIELPVTYGGGAALSFDYEANVTERLTAEATN